jgi:hypothetical protein
MVGRANAVDFAINWKGFQVSHCSFAAFRDDWRSSFASTSRHVLTFGETPVGQQNISNVVLAVNLNAKTVEGQTAKVGHRWVEHKVPVAFVTF